MLPELEEMLNIGAVNYKDDNQDEEANAAECFRGSNTPLLYGGEFVADSSAHCPRMAMMRRAKLPTGHSKTVRDLLSHKYGRAMEEEIKKLITFAAVPNLTTKEEEGYKVTLLNDTGELAYSARPDLVVFESGKVKYVCEFKSVQSNSTAEMVFVNKEPKLGAAIQVAAQMHFHDLAHGRIVYILGHWIDGYSFTTKSRFKFQPGVAVFKCQFNANGFLEVDNGRHTIVSKDGIENGINLLNEMWDARMVPNKRPKSVKLSGASSYNVCDYCVYGNREAGVCDFADTFQDGYKMENFTEIVQERMK